MEIICKGCECIWESNHGISNSNDFHAVLIECPLCLIKEEDKK